MAMVISPRSKIVTLSLLIGIITVVAFIVTVIGIWHKSEKPGKTGTKVVSSKLQQITGYTATKHVSRKFLSYRMERRIITRPAQFHSRVEKYFFHDWVAFRNAYVDIGMLYVRYVVLLWSRIKSHREIVFLCKKKKKKSKVRMTVFIRLCDAGRRFLWIFFSEFQVSRGNTFLLGESSID